MAMSSESDLPPPTVEEQTPQKDLTNQVEMTEDHYFAYGGFSEIFKGNWTDPLTHDVVRVAIKILRGVHTDPVVLETTKRRLNRETRVWHSLSHMNVMPFLGLCDEIGPSPAMISPLYDNGDVIRYLNNNPQADRLAIIIGVAHGLQYLHAKGVVHGDLKGHNVLIDDEGIPRLSDFGRSKFIDHRGFTTTLAGSARYMAPELIAAESDEDYEGDAFEALENQAPPSLTKETDIFAFSMVVLEILTGKIPFFYLKQDTTVIALMQDGRRPDRSRCLPTVFTDPMWKLLVDCWHSDPKRRPSMATVVERLELF